MTAPTQADRQVSAVDGLQLHPDPTRTIRHRRTPDALGHVRQLAGGRWQAYYRQDGETFNAPETFATRPEARTWLAGERIRLYTDQHRWDGALADFATTMGRARLAASTVERVSKHLHRFGADTGRAPYDVTADDVHAWLDKLECSDRARYAYRTSLRTFYRWAHRAGRVITNPAGGEAQPGPPARPAPAGWDQPLAAWYRWLKAGGRAPSTTATYSRHLLALARETGAATPWDLTGEDLADWLARHRWSLETTRSAYSALRGFYRWAHKLGHLDYNPAADLPRVRVPQPNPRPASEADYRDALARANPDEILMLRLAAELGLRRAEVAQVHTRDLAQDDTGQWWLIVHGKGGRSRRLPITPGLSILIRQRPAGYAFPGPRGHLSPQRVGILVSRLLPPDVTMHALRHRFATQAYNIDRDVFTVQRFLGHASPTTTQRYVLTADTTLRRLADAVAGLDRTPGSVAQVTTR